MLRSTLVLLLAMITSFVTQSQSYKPTTSKHLFGNGFYMGSEQDVFTDVVGLRGFNEDRNYTMGAIIGLSGAYTNKGYFVLPWVRRHLTGWLAKDSVKNQTAFLPFLLDESVCNHFISTFDARAGAFTPRDIAASDPVLNDRPYSMIFAFRSQINRHVYHGDYDPDLEMEGSPFFKESALSTSFTLGILGTNIGKAFQSYTHENNWFGSTRPIPEGWHNQVSNNFGLTFLYAMRLTKPLIYDARWQTGHRTSAVQAAATAEIMAGYLVNTAVGLNLRIGMFSTPYWVGFNSLRDMSSGPEIDNKFEFYVYFRPRVRIVGYNALLQGQMLDFLNFGTANHTFSANQIKRLIFEFETGVAFRIYNWTITFEPFAGRTPEFDFPNAQKRWHYWGTFNIAVNLKKD